MAVEMGAVIRGQEDFGRALSRLDSRSARNALQRAFNQSVQPVVKAARDNVDANVGRATGQGRKQIRKRNLRKGERSALNLDQAVLVYLHPDGFYLMFWEFGFTRNGRQYGARPWLRPAVDSAGPLVVRRYRERAGALIEREAAKRR